MAEAVLERPRKSKHKSGLKRDIISQNEVLKNESVVVTNSEIVENVPVSISGVTESTNNSSDCIKDVVITSSGSETRDISNNKDVNYFSAHELLQNISDLEYTNAEKSALEASAPLDVECFQDYEVSEVHQITVLEDTSVRKTKRVQLTEQLLLPDTRDIKPYDENHLQGIYKNKLIEQNNRIIEQFINDDKALVTQHKLYELIQAYYSARIHQQSSQKDVDRLETEITKQVENAWQFEDRVIAEEDMCADDRMVKVQHEYQVAHFSTEVTVSLTKSFKQLREVVYEEHSLHCYTTEMNRILVENYIQKVLSSSTDIQQLTSCSPVTCSESEHPQNMAAIIKEIRLCIGVLFAFQRREFQDEQFTIETRRWLTDFVSVLLRFANFEDHCFLLQHIMRSPRGVAAWGASFVQIATQSSGDVSYVKRVRDHSLAVLDTLLSPVPARCNFLEHLRPNTLANSSSKSLHEHEGVVEAGNEHVWVVMDSEGEEEEQDLQNTWFQLFEQDIVDLLHQVPFEAMFRQILGLSPENSIEKFYDPSSSSHHDFLLLFAFSTQLIRILKTGLETYSSNQFKDLRRRLCRIIRHTIHYVSDHWSCYLLYYLDNPEALSRLDNAPSSTTYTGTFPSENPIWGRLQVEFDELFWRAVNTIVSDPKCWQFLAVIPYSTVSINKLWALSYVLYTGKQFEESNSTPSIGWAALLRHSDTKGQFRDRILNLSQPEAFYLLTAFGNMAAARSRSEADFIEEVVSNVYELSVVCESTREICYKSGRDLLIAVAAKHPDIALSTLLHAFEENMNAVGYHNLVLWRNLSLRLWRPSSEQIHTLLYWLGHCSVKSPENAVARLILSRLNYGFEDTNSSAPESELSSGKLVLPPQMHLQIAFGVVDACVRAEKCLGIDADGHARSNILADSVKTVTAAVCAVAPEQVLVDWCWKQLGMLRLHRLDQLAQLSCFAQSERNGAISPPTLLCGSLLQGVPDVSDSALAPVRTALMDKRLIALYFALLSTSWGHSIPQVCEEGVQVLWHLVEGGRYPAVITALSCITPLFWRSPHSLCTDQKFLEIVKRTLEADYSYYEMAKKLVLGDIAGPSLQLLHAMIHNHITDHIRFGVPCASVPALFWAEILTALPGWQNNASIIYLFDGLCRLLIHSYPAAFSRLSDFFWNLIVPSELLKLCEHPSSSNSTFVTSTGSSVFRPITSLLSWLGSGSTDDTPRILPQPLAHRPWYSLLALRLDTRWEDSTRIWKELLRQLDTRSDVSVDAALKIASSERGVQASVNGLALYRWGQQVLALPVDDSAFLLTLQGFFTRHLARGPVIVEQNYACGSVISRFYEGLVNSSYLQKIKNKVNEAFEYYKRKEEEEKKLVRKCEDDDLILQMEDGIYDGLPQLADCVYKHLLLASMRAWLEDERLYRTGVFLGSLPPYFNPTRLTDIIQENWEPWEETLSRVATDAWSLELKNKWLKHRSRHSHISRQLSSFESLSIASSTSSSRSVSPSVNTVSAAHCETPSAPPYESSSYPPLTASPVVESPVQDTVAASVAVLPSVSTLPLAAEQHLKSIAKRLTEYDVPRPAPALPSRGSLSPPSSPSTGLLRGSGYSRRVDLEALVTEIKNYYGQVLQYAEVMVARWRELCSCDCLLLDLLPKLYSNMERRHVVRQECIPPPPPKGQSPQSCSGQATIILEFSEAQVREGVSVRLDQIEDQRRSLLSRSCSAPPLTVCTAAAAVDELLELLIMEYKRTRTLSPVSFSPYSMIEQTVASSAAPDHQEKLWQIGWTLFWHIIDHATQENYYYPPLKQITASHAAFLGQVFVSDVERCQEEVLQHVFRLDEAKGSLVALHFSPLVVPSEGILDLYNQLATYASADQDIVFVMLSKFDLKQWQPTVDESFRILDIITRGMHRLLGERDRDVSLAFGMYHMHWRSILLQHFDAIFIQALRQLFYLSLSVQEETAALLSQVWFDLLNLASSPKIDVPEPSSNDCATPLFVSSLPIAEMINNIRKCLLQEIQLSERLVLESIDAVSFLLQEQRLEHALYGLYSVYRHTALPLALWHCLMSHAVTHYSQFWCARDSDQFGILLEKIWALLESIWCPWIYPYLTQSKSRECPKWVVDMVGNKRFLQPWNASDVQQANFMLSCYGASLSYLHQTWKDLRGSRYCILSRILQRYCCLFADRDVKEIVLTALHVHLLNSLPWHHLVPSVYIMTLFSKVINKYLPECHSFIGHVLVQVPWNSVINEAMSITLNNDVDAESNVVNDGLESPPLWETDDLSPRTDKAAVLLEPVKLHSLLLNLIVRISMEPSVRQSGPLQELLVNAQKFHWELLDAQNLEQVLNWYVLSCDPRVVLPMPGRNKTDYAVIQLLHVAANYTPSCTTFHAQTGLKRVMLLKTMVRLLTSAAQRHKVLLSTQASRFEEAYDNMLSHMETTILKTCDAENKEMTARPLCVELLTAISCGASSQRLQKVCVETAVQWCRTETHESADVLHALLWAACKNVLHLQHRTLLIDALVEAALYVRDIESGFDKIVSLLSFPSTHPEPMILQAAQDGKLLSVYCYVQWRRRQYIADQKSPCRKPRSNGDSSPTNNGCESRLSLLLNYLLTGIKAASPIASSEIGFLLLLGEALDLISEHVASGVALLSVWQDCSDIALILSIWEEDRRTTGLLGTFGLGPRSEVSIKARFICRSIRTFLVGQLVSPGVFCSVNDAPLSSSNTADTVPSEAALTSSAASLTALSGLLALRMNTIYNELLFAIERAVIFIQDSSNIITDTPKLYAELISLLYKQNPVVGHLAEVTSSGRLQYNVRWSTNTDACPKALNAVHKEQNSYMYPKVGALSVNAPDEFQLENSAAVNVDDTEINYSENLNKNVHIDGIASSDSTTEIKSEENIVCEPTSPPL